ncbi:tolloid-like protein 2 isoform X2 [Montipora capricornis]|uniref:tolloid-like protein 2 isoform X2 n=1 Tax=Montipora capricornis TaxID=246305 RepID=UPI0035F1CE4C
MSSPTLLVFYLVVLAKCSTEVLCKGCEVLLTNLNGTITTPLSPNQSQTYPSKDMYTCKWNIELQNAAEHRHVELHFKTFELTASMPDCLDGDHVEIFLGCKNLTSIGKFCGHTSLPVIYSSDHCLQIVLRIHSVVAGSSRSVFEAVYNQRLLSRAVSQEYYGCGKDLHSNVRHGNIFSPHWPLPYPHYVDCVWHVTTRPGFQVKVIFFDFEVRFTHSCQVDFVEMKTGAVFDRRRSSRGNRKCGKKRPFFVILTETSIFVHFKSDLAFENRGFMVGFVVYGVDDQESTSQALIALGVIISIIIVLVGKAVLQKLLKRHKLDVKSVFYRVGNTFKPVKSLTVVSLLKKIDEPEQRSSVVAQWETSSSDSETKEKQPPSKPPGGTVTFKTAKKRGRKDDSVEYYMITQSKPEVRIM